MHQAYLSIWRASVFNYVIYLHRGYARFAQQDFGGAIVELTNAIEQKPDLSEAFSNRAVAKFNTGDFDGAIGDYDEAIRLMPDDLRALIFSFRGEVKFKAGDAVGAIDDYNEAIRRGLRISEVFINRGRAWVQIGDITGAKDDFEEALSLAIAQNQLEETLIEIQKELDALGSEDDPPNSDS